MINAQNYVSLSDCKTKQDAFSHELIAELDS